VPSSVASVYWTARALCFCARTNGYASKSRPR
jgi:hypothetical protein